MEILKYTPCREALEFRNQFSTFQEAWQACPRGDWMLWLAAKMKINKRLLTLAKGRCAETVKHLMKDERSIRAIEAVIAYGNGEIDDKELTTYAEAAYAAAAAFAAYIDAEAAYAAAAAAFAYVAADAAYAAAYAADAAAVATFAYVAADAAYAAYAAARKQNQLQTANICRELLTDAVMAEI